MTEAQKTVDPLQTTLPVDPEKLNAIRIQGMMDALQDQRSTALNEVVNAKSEVAMANAKLALEISTSRALQSQLEASQAAYVASQAQLASANAQLAEAQRMNTLLEAQVDSLLAIPPAQTSAIGEISTDAIAALSTADIA